MSPNFLRSIPVACFMISPMWYLVRNKLRNKNYIGLPLQQLLIQLKRLDFASHPWLLNLHAPQHLEWLPVIIVRFKLELYSEKKKKLTRQCKYNLLSSTRPISAWRFANFVRCLISFNFFSTGFAAWLFLSLSISAKQSQLNIMLTKNIWQTFLRCNLRQQSSNVCILDTLWWWSACL